ncbi:hypothetical protein BDZ89DRAFT_1038959 [Hymenopellis radicata]|nr:hypothetical protein BDZ89DRAFT_1142921 [Hymenopellis radicata]KAF9028585.1 hypothetical protein BDZ89DRAFT_1038959 [Hymenopellis radicata]
MPGGRPRKIAHPGGRPVLYQTDDARKAARKSSRDRWYFDPRVHERVKKNMRMRYERQGNAREEEASQQEGDCRMPGTVICHENTSHPRLPALAASCKLQNRLTSYLQSSESVFLQKTLRLVMDKYTPGQASPLLDRIQEDLSEMDAEGQACLNELLNTVGAWANEYCDVQRVHDRIKWVLRTIIEIQCSAMEETLEEAVRQKKFSFLK